MKARVTVTLKTGILDPQGKAIEGALKSLGVAGIASVRQGKVFDIELDAAGAAAAEATLKSACEKLLANTVIENYSIELFNMHQLPTRHELFSGGAERMSQYFQILKLAPALSFYERSKAPNRAGCYCLYENDLAVYVGSAGKIRQRLGNHFVGDLQQSTLAVKLARISANRPRTYRAGAGLKSLKNDTIFMSHFKNSVTRVRQLYIRWVEVEDANDRHLLEFYLAFVLETPYNSFETH